MLCVKLHCSLTPDTNIWLCFEVYGSTRNLSQDWFHNSKICQLRCLSLVADRHIPIQKGLRKPARKNWFCSKELLMEIIHAVPEILIMKICLDALVGHLQFKTSPGMPRQLYTTVKAFRSLTVLKHI